eukprot:Pgem_evm3s5701
MFDWYILRYNQYESDNDFTAHGLDYFGIKNNCYYENYQFFAETYKYDKVADLGECESEYVAINYVEPPTPPTQQPPTQQPPTQQPPTQQPPTQKPPTQQPPKVDNVDNHQPDNSSSALSFIIAEKRMNICKYCNKNLSSKQKLNKHLNVNNKCTITKYKEENEILMQENIEKNKEIQKLKEQLLSLSTNNKTTSPIIINNYTSNNFTVNQFKCNIE